MLKQTAKGVEILVQIQPGARRNEIVGEHADAMKIKIQAPPVDGKANDALVSFLSLRLEVPKSRVHILSGETSRRKKILIVGLSAEQVRAKLMS